MESGKKLGKRFFFGQMTVSLGQKREMKKRKVADESPVVSFVSEPAVSYSTTSAGYSNSFSRPVALMGLASTSPFKEVQTELDYIECIRAGLPKKALDSIMEVTGFSNTDISKIIHISDRTLRRYAPKQKLDPEQSERVLELARLYSRGEQIFGSLQDFKTWMDREVLALGSKKPKTFLDTSLGIEMLMDELGRIEHGVFA